MSFISIDLGEFAFDELRRQLLNTELAGRANIPMDGERVILVGNLEIRQRKLSKEQPKYPCIAIDFDGVIHAYTSPWESAGVIKDGPVDGAIDFIRQAIAEGFHVAIHTSRVNDASVRGDIVDWLHKHGLESENVGQLTITAQKVAAIVYIDDRGYRFEGRFPSFDEIRALKQWNKP